MTLRPCIAILMVAAESESEPLWKNNPKLQPFRIASTKAINSALRPLTSCELHKELVGPMLVKPTSRKVRSLVEHYGSTHGI
jgi:hypothetical protein